MENGDPVTVYRQFLENFSIKIDNLCHEDCETPFRISNTSIVPSELEGECLEWIRRCLLMHECPYGLISQLARAVLKNFLSVANLTDFYLESDDKGSDEENADDAESNPSSEEDHFDGSSSIQLSCPKILPELISHIHTTVKTWSVAPPVFVKPPVKFHVCSHAIKNTRRKMEDRHVVLTDLNVLFDLKDCPSQSYFAVFDGHGGLEAADYAAKHFHCHLVADESFDLDPAQAIKQAYKSTDIRFLEKAKRESLRSGTTGVNVLIRESKMYIGWLGDSQAIVVRAGQPMTVMSAHKPEREDEKRRIEDLGGCVMFFGAWRVNGNISVSRAIGDAPHKPFISSDADVTTVVMNGEEEYLVLACDGLWDVMSPSQVTQMVYKHANTSPGGLEDVANGLVNAARDLGSSDNISVVVVLFKSSLAKPQPPQDKDMLFNFTDISSNNVDNDFSSSSSSSTFNGCKESKMNDRLKLKPNNNNNNNAGGGGSSSDSFTFLDNGSSNNNNNNNNNNYHNHHGITTTTGSFSVNHSSRRDSTRVGVGEVGIGVGADSRTTISSRVLEVPYSNDLVRQAMFYVSPRGQGQDTGVMTLALSKAIKGDKEEKRKKRRSASESGRGFSRQSSFSRSPRRPSVRPLSKVTQPINPSRSSGKYSNLKSSKKNSRSRRKSGSSSRLVINETSWLTSDDNTTDDDDRMSIASSNYIPTKAIMGAHRKAMKQLQQPHSGRPESGSASLHLTGSTLALAALGMTDHSKSLPQLSGKSLNLGNRSILPGIQVPAPKSMGRNQNQNNLSSGSEFGVDPYGKISRSVKALSVLGEEGYNTQHRPAFRRGSSVLSDSYALGSKGGDRMSLSLGHVTRSDGMVGAQMESGPKTSRSGHGRAGTGHSSYRWGKS